jgi:hypothetical protein
MQSLGFCEEIAWVWQGDSVAVKDDNQLKYLFKTIDIRTTIDSRM